MAKGCTHCGSSDHTQFYCRSKPRKQMVTSARLNHVGKQGKKTASAVAKWRAKQKPNHQGYYKCYIGGEYISVFYAEHPYSKARHPELRTTQKFEIVCDSHNALKGSLDIDEFLEKYPQFKSTVKREYLINKDNQE